MHKIDTSSLFSITFIAILAISSYLFKIELMNYVRLVLENGQLKSVLLIFVTIIVISHSIKIKADSGASSAIIHSGLLPLDIFLTLGTYIAITTTACSLLEGAFIQKFFGIEYFSKFNDLDIYVLLGVAALLLWYVAFHMYKMASEVLFKTETVSISNTVLHNQSIKPTATAPTD